MAIGTRTDSTALPTKGPWKVDQYGSVLDGNGERLLAYVSFPTGNHPKADEIAANSRLIASAPELLEACELAARMLRDGGRFPIEGQTYQLLRAAIKKAGQ